MHRRCSKTLNPSTLVGGGSVLFPPERLSLVTLPLVEASFIWEVNGVFEFCVRFCVRMMNRRNVAFFNPVWGDLRRGWPVWPVHDDRFCGKPKAIMPATANPRPWRQRQPPMFVLVVAQQGTFYLMICFTLSRSVHTPYSDQDAHANSHQD